MKMLPIFLHTERNRNEEPSIRTKACKFFKFIPVILLLSSTLFLSSCMFPGPGHERHGGGMNDHGREHHESHDHEGHHD